MLEQSIERLSREDYQPRCQCPHSHSCSWERIQEQCLPSLSPHRPRRWVTFPEPEEEISTDEELQRECSTSGEMGDRDLGFPPTMCPDLKQFMGMPAAGRSAGHRQNMLLEPSIKNYKNGWNGGHGNWTPPLVGGIDYHIRCGGCLEIGPEDPGLL